MSEVSQFTVQDKLKALSVILRFNDVIGNTNVLRALHTTGLKTWKESVNSNTQAHLIEGIHTTGFKTDAINHYISVLVKVFMSSNGANLSGWTKNSLEAENTFTTVVANRMGAKLYNNHNDLFIDVVTRLLGFDKALSEYVVGLEEDTKRVDLLVGYVASQFDDLVGIDNAEIYYDLLIDHLGHVDLVKDRDDLITTAIKVLDQQPGVSGYDALLESAQTVIGYVIGDRTGEKDKVFTFGKAQY